MLYYWITLSIFQVNLLLELKSGAESLVSPENLMSPDKAGDKQPGLKRKFIRCSSLATVTHLKKYIAKKLLSGVTTNQYFSRSNKKYMGGR